MTVPGKGGRPRKWLSDTDRVRAYRARQRGEPEPPTATDAAHGGDALAAALQRQHDLEVLLAEARTEISELRRRLTGTEFSILRLEEHVVELERDRAELMSQVNDLHQQRRPQASDLIAEPPQPSPATNRAARRRADRKRHQ